MAQGQRNFQIVFGVVVVVGAVFLASKLIGGKPVSIPANPVVTITDTAGFRGYEVGDSMAPIEIAEYAAYTCPFCALFDAVWWPDLKSRLIDTRIARWRFRDYPLGHVGEHRWSWEAALAAACANDQNKFWPVKEAIFMRQGDWSASSNAIPVFAEIIKAAGLEETKWTECMKSSKYAGRIQASYDEGTKLGVNSTPTFLIGDRLYTLDRVRSADAFVRLVDSLSKVAKPSVPATPTKP